MRYFLIALLGLAFLGLSNVAAAQGAGKLLTANIQTSARCGMCKTAIEGALNKAPGVHSATLDLTTKKLRVRYYRNQISLATIRQIVSETGYDADAVAANTRAHDALPGCCQKQGVCTDDEAKH